MRAKHKHCLSLGAQLNLDHSPVMPRLGERSCSLRMLHRLLPSTPASVLLRAPRQPGSDAGRRTQDTAAIGCLHNRTGRPAFMSWLRRAGGGVASGCLFLGQPSRQFLWPSLRLPASLALSSVCLPHFCSPFHQLQMWHTAVLEKS